MSPEGPQKAEENLCLDLEHCSSHRCSATRKVHFESLGYFWNLLSISKNFTHVVFKLIVISLIS